MPVGAPVQVTVGDTEKLLRDAAASLHRLTRVVPDFPTHGVLFRDVTPVFADRHGLALISAAVAATSAEFDLVAGLDARGFLIGGAVAALCGTGVLAVRKPGKLAGAVIGEDYTLEYGAARLEVHPDDVPIGARVLVVDDVLATGGTAAAACALLRRAGAVVVGLSVMVELTDLGGRAAVQRRGPVSVNAISRF